jgi:hypothetical protein
LTSTAAVVLLVLFSVEIITVVLGVWSVLTLHVMVGLILVPPILVKISSVSWRFIQYYRHDEEYRRKGPPAPALRLLSPVLLFVTIVLFASGIGLLWAPLPVAGSLRKVHSASFYIWLPVLIAHVAAHARTVRRVAPRDWVRSSRATTPGAVVRQMIVLASLAIGLVLALSLVGQVGVYRHQADRGSVSTAHTSAVVMAGSSGRPPTRP